MLEWMGKQKVVNHHTNQGGRARTPCGPLTVREALALPDDQRKVLEEFASVASAEPDVTLLHRMFEKTVQANPSKTSLVAVDRTLTFAELDAEADAVAANLQAKGVGKGDAVVLLLPRKSSFFSANARAFQPLLAYRGMAGDSSFVPANPTNVYTTQVLARLGHFWKAIGEDYIRRFVAVLKDLEFFETI